ncbi:MAG TPA: DNA cytosine methyltransferase, partial [Tissierellales bacterium]|nr:DNA cytosine methyltransferase [Tissierellales bacterium]
KKGHDVFSVEWDKQHKNIDLYIDIKNLTKEMIISNFGKPDIIWASPDCTTYSIAGISHHRKKEENGNLYPISEKAIISDNVNNHVLKLIEELKPKYFFIENPRGGLRKMEFMKDIPRYTVTYCQYGDNRMKPTDIWTNYEKPNFLPMCKNGDKCHDSAPRGSKTGTQALSLIDRSKIPNELCNYIVNICEKGL